MKSWISLFLVVAIIGLVEAQFHIVRKLLGREALGQRELATQVLGEYLASQYAGKKAIVLSNPFSQKSGQPRQVYQFEKAGLRGLRRGLGSAVLIEAVEFPEIRPGFFRDPSSIFIDPATTTPLSYLVAETSLDAIAQRHPEAEIIISLIGLPLNLLETKTWKAAAGQRFALLLPDLRMVGNQTAILQAISQRKLAAMVINKPGAPPEDQPLGKDLKMEFDQRFLLITAQSVGTALRAYPKLF